MLLKVAIAQGGFEDIFLQLPACQCPRPETTAAGVHDGLVKSRALQNSQEAQSEIRLRLRLRIRG